MSKLSDAKWSSDLHYCTDLMSLLQKISEVVDDVTDFMIDMIAVTEMHNLRFSKER